MMWKAAFFILIYLSTGCTAYPRLPSENCPVKLIQASDLPQDLSFRAQVQIQKGKHQINFEAIAESKSGALTLVGIAPYGTRLFQIQQKEGEIHFSELDSSIHRSLAIFTMDALYRAYWIRAPSKETSWDYANEIVTEGSNHNERYREFRQSGPREASGSVKIDYGFESDNRTTAVTTIENPWCGYSASIVQLKNNSGNQEP